MYFMVENDLSDTMALANDPLIFKYDRQGLVVSIQRGVPWSAADKQEALFCRTVAGRQPDPASRETLEGLMSGRNPPPDPEPITFHTDERGRIVEEDIVLPSSTPASIKDFVRDIELQIRDYASRTLRVLRWKVAAYAEAAPFKNSRGLWCSPDSKTWYKIPSALHVTHEIRPPLQASAEMCAEVMRIVEGGADEPIWHVLWREAWHRRGSARAGAIVLAVSAAEVAVKRHASGLAPDVAWLMENLPSPPVMKLLKRYLPSLYSSHRVAHAVQFPADLLRVLDKGIEERNKIVHLGTMTFSAQATDKLLKTVLDLLWIVDHNGGETWALDYLRRPTREAIAAAADDELHRRS